MRTISMSVCHQTHHHHNHVHDHIPPGRLKMDTVTPRWQKSKVVFLMGATGTGKSKLSLDLAAQFPAEIINSDKMQVHKGLEITTNKITEEERSGIPHHMLGVVHPNADFTAKDFCFMASQSIESISTRGLLPIIVGGSNSFIEALVDDADYRFRSKYDCCFLWVDVSMSVLHDFLSKRVDQMVKKGMVDEVRNIFDPYADYSTGIRRSIGVPEFDKYLRAEVFMDEANCNRLLEEAISEVKNNNCKLACRQLEKIRRLKYVKGWNIHRIDVTQAFCRRRGKEAHKAWRKLVAGPSIAIVRQFLYSSVTAAKVSATVLPPPPKDFAQCLVS